MGEPKIVAAKDELRVEVDFPEPLPITDEELALIEAHLIAIISQFVDVEASEGR